MPKRGSTEAGDTTAKKAKADDAENGGGNGQGETDFSCDLKAPNGKQHNLKISAWNVAGERNYALISQVSAYRYYVVSNASPNNS